MRRTAGVTALLVALSVLGAVVAPTTARPANEVPVEPIAGNATSPTADVWTEVPSATLALSSAPSGLPQASNVSTERVSLQVATNGTHAFVRLSWRDATVDRNVTGPRSFVDAAAVQFPANASAHPPLAMGGRDNQVNVWYWRADGQTEELLAGGAGTTSEFPTTRIASRSVNDNGTWRVTFTRPLSADGNRTDLAVDRDVDVAVAVWNGSYHERGGRKAVSEWHYVALGPSPQGPPYETVLWLVAGLAVLFVTLVTIEGVRRTRGDLA